MNQIDMKQQQDKYIMVEKVVVQGDLATLTPQERLSYYKQVCESVGLNPITRPFEYIKLNSKLTLYAKRDATDQLRSIKGISIKIAAREKVDDLYIVTAQATDKNGRVDESVGAVNLAGLKGEAAANAIMKAETKAKRRVTLSIAGLGFLDETEVTSIPNAGNVRINQKTGEIEDFSHLTISASQAADLEALCVELGVEKNKFFEFFGIKNFSDITLDNLARVNKLLERKRAKITDITSEPSTDTATPGVDPVVEA